MRERFVLSLFSFVFVAFASATPSSEEIYGALDLPVNEGGEWQVYTGSESNPAVIDVVEGAQYVGGSALRIRCEGGASASLSFSLPIGRSVSVKVLPDSIEGGYCSLSGPDTSWIRGRESSSSPVAGVHQEGEWVELLSRGSIETGESDAYTLFASAEGSYEVVFDDLQVFEGVFLAYRVFSYLGDQSLEATVQVEPVKDVYDPEEWITFSAAFDSPTAALVWGLGGGVARPADSRSTLTVQAKAKPSLYLVDRFEVTRGVIFKGGSMAPSDSDASAFALGGPLKYTSDHFGRLRFEARRPENDSSTRSFFDTELTDQWKPFEFDLVPTSDPVLIDNVFSGPTVLRNFRLDGSTQVGEALGGRAFRLVMRW